MRKITFCILSVLATIFAFGACDISSLQGVMGGVGRESLTSLENLSKGESEQESDEGTSENSEATPEQSEEPNDGEDETPKEETKTYLYNAFTASEKTLFSTYIGEVIPFLPNNEYYVEGYYDTDDYENGMCFYAIGNTQSEFDAYRTLYSAYTLTETELDEYGDLWYTYEKDSLVVDMCYYYDEGEYALVVYVYSTELSTDENPDAGENPDEGEEEGSSYTYTDFTDEEKALFETYIGEVIPFLPNDEYYVEGRYDKTDYENGMCFYTIGCTEMGFALYRAMYSDYDFTGTMVDEYGDTWYTYEKDSLVVDMCYYYDKGEYWLVVYVCKTAVNGGDDTDEEIPDVNPDDNQGGGTMDEDTGTRVVDFTQATNVKYVKDLGDYEYGCPTTGTVKVLVIPVEFSDKTAASKGYTTDKLDKVFNGGAGSTTYHSVAEYYNISSYEQLDLEFVVLDNWFRPSQTSSYYKNSTMEYYGEDTFIGDQIIMDEALAYLESRMNLSEFDADGDTVIDAVVMINTLEIDSEVDFNWAYRYWNIYTDAQDYYYEYDGVSANDYIWASYQFMLEEYDAFGNVSYNKSIINPYTYIHEFGHILGAEDYYDTSYSGGDGPTGGYDMMDAMLGDHNPYTKFNYGWLTTARLITAEESVTLTLESFTKTGDAVIIANNWSDKLGAYQEYYVVVYYTNTGLNTGEGGFFEDEGILVYHVNATLKKETYGGEIYYSLENNNTDPSDAYGTEDNLIELIKSADGGYVFSEYDSLAANQKMDDGKKVSYVFTVNDIAEGGATVTFRKNA